VQQQGVEEQRVAGLHLDVDALGGGPDALHAEEADS
jgi:hypothetical protein